MKSSKKILQWGISRVAENGCKYEIFDYLVRTAAPDPADPVLLDRLKVYFDEPLIEFLVSFVGDLTEKAGRDWKIDDFALKRRPKKRIFEDDEQGPEPLDTATLNLSRLIAQFIGYARREEGIPYVRGQMVAHQFFAYFIGRHEGELDPRPSMMKQMDNPELKLPKPPPPPVHPLCPERVTLEVHLTRMMGLMSASYHTATTLFLAMPAWLRFLETRRLIDADIRRHVVKELLPLHAAHLKPLESYAVDPTRNREAQAWPADAAKDLSTTAGG